MSEVVRGKWSPRPAAPYEAGNTAALKHGAWSPRKVDPLAGELVDQALELAGSDGSSTGYLLELSYRPALWAWARAEARAQLVAEWIGAQVGPDGVGDLGDDAVHRAWSLLDRWERAAARERARLGLDPLSRARLGRDVAAAQVDVAQLMARLERRADP